MNMNDFVDMDPDEITNSLVANRANQILGRLKDIQVKNI